MGEVYLRPNSGLDGNWDDSRYTNIDEVVYQPTTGTIDEIKANKDDDNETERYEFTTDTITNWSERIEIWLYGRITVVGDQPTVNISVDGNWQIAQTTTLNTGTTFGDATWTSYIFTGITATQLAVDGLIVRLITGNMPVASLLHIYTLYAEVGFPSHITSRYITGQQGTRPHELQAMQNTFPEVNNADKKEMEKDILPTVTIDDEGKMKRSLNDILKDIR